MESSVEAEDQVFNFTGTLLGASLVPTGLFHDYFLAPKMVRKGSLVAGDRPLSNLIPPLFKRFAEMGKVTFLSIFE